MAYPSVTSAYAAASTAGVGRDSMLLITTTEKWTPKFREILFNQTPFFQAMALNAFGSTKIIDGAASYGNNIAARKSSGKGIQFHGGGFQFGGPLLDDAPSGNVVGRMGNINPEYVNTGTSFAYPYRRMVWSIFLPEEEVKDNTGNEKLMSLMDIQFKLAQRAANRDVNYAMLGHASAPTNSPSGLNALVSVTQGTIGAVSASTTTDWANQYRTCTTVGGGGELDRPLVLLRKMSALHLDVKAKSGSSDSRLMIGTRGAYQYYMRAAYADRTAQGAEGARVKKYYDAGIDHCVFEGDPFLYDPSVTVPTGATASTECIYTLDLAELGMAVKRNEFFDVEKWEAPRTHDKQRYYQMNIWLRFTPFVSNRRIQGGLYNLPANADAS